MKNKILRTLLLIVVSLAGKMAIGQSHQTRYNKFVVPHAGYLTVDQWVNWVASGNSSGMTVICDREVYKQYLYSEIRNRGAVCNSDEDFLNLYRSGRFGGGIVYMETIRYPYSNTAWSKSTNSVVRLGDVTMRYGYMCFDGEPIAKGTCANVINKHIVQVTPAPAPTPVPPPAPVGTFNPCDNQYYVLGPVDQNGFRWTADGNMAYMAGIWYQKYTTDRNGQPYTDGLLHIDTLECQKVKKPNTSGSVGCTSCTSVVNVYNITKTSAPSKPEPEVIPVYSTMGRVYQSPGFYEAPPINSWWQGMNFFSIALNLIPRYNWSPLPQTWQGRPIFQGLPIDGGNPVYSWGAPFGGGNQFSHQNPLSTGFDGGNGGFSSSGSPFGGGGYISGVAQRVR